MNIQPITFPVIGTANDFLLRVLPFDMDAKSCSFYYELRHIENDTIKTIVSGNIDMNETEFYNWGADNNYCLEWAAQKLGIVML